MKTPSIQSVANAFEILEYILKFSMISEGVGLAQIAERFGMKKTTACNMLQTLECCGYIRRGARGVYYAGEKCAMLSQAAVFAGAFREELLGYLKAAALLTDDSYLLTTLFNGQRLAVATVENGTVIDRSEQNIADEQKFNHARMTMRVLLAFCSDEERRRFQTANADDADWMASPQLEADLQKIRRDRFSEQQMAEWYAAAYPVFDCHGRFLGAIGGYARTAAASPEKMRQIKSILLNIADKIAKRSA